MISTAKQFQNVRFKKIQFGQSGKKTSNRDFLLQAITIEAEERSDGARRTTRYDIDMTKLVFTFNE